MRRLRSGWQRRPKYSTRVWVFWAIGVAVLLSAPVVIWDPAMIALILDPELLALVIAVGITMARLSAQSLRARAAAAAAAAAAAVHSIRSRGGGESHPWD